MQVSSYRQLYKPLHARLLLNYQYQYSHTGYHNITYVKMKNDLTQFDATFKETRTITIFTIL